MKAAVSSARWFDDDRGQPSLSPERARVGVREASSTVAVPPPSSLMSAVVVAELQRATYCCSNLKQRINKRFELATHLLRVAGENLPTEAAGRLVGGVPIREESHLRAGGCDLGLTVLLEVPQMCLSMVPFPVDDLGPVPAAVYFFL